MLAAAQGNEKTVATLLSMKAAIIVTP